MKKQESKITTLCRLVAVYNCMLRSRTPKECAAVRVDGIITHNTHVHLILVIDDNTSSIYNGGLDGGIAYMAKCLCL